MLIHFCSNVHIYYISQEYLLAVLVYVQIKLDMVQTFSLPWDIYISLPSCSFIEVFSLCWAWQGYAKPYYV